jgi:hypothetical protein
MHDDLGRLVRRYIGPENTPNVYRYEFNKDHNVTKIYYKTPSTVEFLGRENLSFDGYPRFYASVKDLKILNIYIHNHEPSRNNCITAIEYWANPMVENGPLNVTHKLRYNDHGMVTEFSTDQGLIVSGFSFDEMVYECK